MISTRSTAPFALMLVAPHVEGDKTPPGRINYQFYDIVVNDPWRLFHGDPFKPFTPRGWMLVPDTTPLVPPQAGTAVRRRGDLRRNGPPLRHNRRPQNGE